MTPNRIAILQYVAAHTVVASTRAPSRALGRDYSGVQADIAELVKLDLLKCDGNVLRCKIEPDVVELMTV